MDPDTGAVGVGLDDEGVLKRGVERSIGGGKELGGRGAQTGGAPDLFSAVFIEDQSGREGGGTGIGETKNFGEHGHLSLAVGSVT